MTLPRDLASALTDGVVLCHLANHVRPRSVASIHVPSPAVVSFIDFNLNTYSLYMAIQVMQLNDVEIFTAQTYYGEMSTEC